MEKFGKLVTVLLAMVISPIISGFVFSKLWGWFIVPIFHVQPLRIVESIGILILIQFVRLKRNKDDEKKKDFWEDFWHNVLIIVLASAFTLLYGWIVFLFL